MLTTAQREALQARLRRGRPALAEAITRRPAGLADLPLSSGQEQLWFLDQLTPGLPAYNIPLVFRLSGALDRAALGGALDDLAARHEALRTRLVAGPDGRPRQMIDVARPVPLPVTEWPSGDPARLREFIDTEAVRPFSLASGPLLRTRLLRLAATEHLLLMVAHHAVFDGWSAGVFGRELTALYRARVTGQPSGLPGLPVQFADYAVWERGRLHGSVLDELTGYWRDALAGAPTVEFPADRPRPVLDTFEGGLVQHLTDRALLDGLRELSRQHRTTLFVTLMAGLHALLHRYTGQTDLVVGTVSANRARPELAPLIGFLVNTLPVRCDLSGDPPFTELMARVQQAVTAGYAHQDLPFATMVQALRVERDPARAPLFQIMLSYAERDDTTVPAAGVEFTPTDLVAGVNAAKFDLDFLAEARRGGLWLECSYKTRLFDPATIERLLNHFEVLLCGALASPSARLSRLPVLTQAELRRELVDWNDTGTSAARQCVHEGFEAQAALTPDAVAAEFGGEQWSYAELNQRANRIARRLRDLGVRPETLVGVCMETGLARLAALLGIWKAGGGYVPLDPALPPGRLAFMITDTGMPLVLADAATAGRLSATGATVLSLDGEQPVIDALPGSNLPPAGPDEAMVRPANVAYVIYTSGSTGQPKGVLVEHRQAVNFLYGMVQHWRIGPADTVLQFASLSFDASVQEMFMPLLGGARVVLAAASTLHSPRRLAALMRERGVTFACLTPSVVSLLGDEPFPGLRVLMCGGEELPSELARRWTRPGLRFVNDYGPTETTVTAVFMELAASTELPPPIGRPSRPNYRAYVLDSCLNPVPVGALGELHIGGAGVARGYLNRPGLTAERFIADPFTPGQRLYKTGDLVRRRPDGTIVFAGRADGQVKVHGLRIELGEIEAALAAHPDVLQAVVAVPPGPDGNRQLTGYLRARPGRQPTAAGLRRHLAGRLPGYMIPGHLVFVAEFPLNASGKIDKAALPPPQPPPPAGRVPPATLIETMVASLYAALLGQAEIGVTDSFFDLGGNSLQVMRLVRMMDDELDVDLDVASVFLAPTPRQLAALLRDEHGFTDADLGAAGEQPGLLPGEGPGQPMAEAG